MTDGLLDLARMDEAALYRHFDSSSGGLTEQAAQEKLDIIGPNRIADDVRLSVLREILRRLMTPLNGLLLGLAVTSWALSDYRSAIVIAIMVLLSVGLGYVQEHRSSMAAARLKRMVQVHASVKRATPDFAEMPLEVLVPGDIVRLAAGDLIPADLRLLSAHDLHVNESSLTGEAMPVEKRSSPDADAAAPFDAPNLCFMGSSVVSGFAEGIILKTGRATYFGEVAKQITGADTTSSFDRGLNQFVALMLRFMAVRA